MTYRVGPAGRLQSCYAGVDLACFAYCHKPAQHAMCLCTENRLNMQVSSGSQMLQEGGSEAAGVSGSVESTRFRLQTKLP